MKRWPSDEPPGSGHPVVVHVAQINLTPESGMGRVSWHWRARFEERGHEFLHIGAAEVGSVHPALFPYAAYRHYRRLRIRPAAVLVHEPAGVPFLPGRSPVIAFSHGVERRAWQTSLALVAAGHQRIRPRSRVLFPVWRLLQADLTLRYARAVLVLNSEDRGYVERVYRRRPEEVLRFRNGVEIPESQTETPAPRTTIPGTSSSSAPGWPEREPTAAWWRQGGSSAGGESPSGSSFRGRVSRRQGF